MNNERLMKVILGPHSTEKTARAEVQGFYTFRVGKDATKREIKHAIELLFSVAVDSVKVLNVKGEVLRRQGRVSGKSKAWKKAYVKLKEGQTISTLAASA